MRYKLAFYVLFWRIHNFNGRDMPQAVSRRSVTMQVQVHLRFEEYKVAMEEISFRVLRVFSVSIIPFSTLIALLSEDQRAIPGNIPTEKFSF